MKKLIGLCALSLLLTGCSSSTAEPTPTSTPEVKKLTADYDGATKGGTMIDDDNKGVHVYLEESGGEKEEVTGWHIKNPTPLKAGENNSITVWYEDDYCILYIQADNSVELLEAVYDGETREGTVLDKDKILTVTYCSVGKLNVALTSGTLYAEKLNWSVWSHRLSELIESTLVTCLLSTVN